MYYSYIKIEYVATGFTPARTDLAVKLLRYWLAVPRWLWLTQWQSLKGTWVASWSSTTQGFGKFLSTVPSSRPFLFFGLWQVCNSVSVAFILCFPFFWWIHMCCGIGGGSGECLGCTLIICWCSWRACNGFVWWKVIDSYRFFFFFSCVWVSLTP